MLQNLLNVGENSLKRRNFSVMMRKVFLRFKEHSQIKQKDAVGKWCANNSERYEVFLKSLDQTLWDETQDACIKIKSEGEAKLKDLGIDLGGGGNYPILYFFTRYLSAKTVVETGVAAGWSSKAILSALKKNGSGGQLYSSDFPYFRHKKPEKLIGYIVDEQLKGSWHLFIDGDQNNLPTIADKVESIDLLHYDSDKSYGGRLFALKILENKMYDNSVIIFDDIQDNFHFKDYVEKNNLKFKLFEFEGKYIGLIAPFL